MTPPLDHDGSPSASRIPPTTNRDTTTSDPSAPSNPHVTPDEQEPPSTETSSTNPPQPSTTTTTTTDRTARFAALRARATASSAPNLAEARAEATRTAINPELLTTLSRKSAIAAHNLLKADTEDAEGPGTFERKRAWDYTIEESERWDERVARKKEMRNNNVFQDYGREAGKIYDRQIREMGWRADRDGTGGGEGAKQLRDEYERLKSEALSSAGLEVVELSNGDLVAIDNEGTLYSGTDSTGFVEQKPKKENVDRLVADLKKAEEVRLKKRRDRGRAEGDEGDVTYINDKNKQFNLKLARFYDKYTGDIRESFERGTAI